MKINYEVPSPFAIQLEPTEGCSLACSFCGIQAIRNNGADAQLGIHGKNSAPYKYMTTRTVEEVARQAAELGWNPRWEFAMHGEPTMHPDLPALVAAVRRWHGKGCIMVTSNGSGLLKNPEAQVKALFAAGVNTLALDDYKHSGGWVPRICAALEEDVLGAQHWKTFRYPAQKDGNPHQRHSGMKLVIINDISDNSTGTHQLTNQGGNSFARITEPLAERCAKPFRELSIRWNGNVALCCDDWKGAYKIGNVLSLPLRDIWYHPAFEAARRKLYYRDRAFGPCAGCNVRTVRNGLLPDKLGKGKMDEPDAASELWLHAAMAGDPYSVKERKS